MVTKNKKDPDIRGECQIWLENILRVNEVSVRRATMR